MVKEINIEKRNKVTKFLKRAGVAIVAVASLPTVFSNYVFQDTNKNNLFQVKTDILKAHKDIIGKSFIDTNDKEINYNGNGEISSIVSGGRTWTFTWVSGELQSISDGSITKTFTWSSGQLTDITVTGGL